MKSFNKQEANKLKSSTKLTTSFIDKMKFKSEPTLDDPAPNEMVECFMKNTS